MTALQRVVREVSGQREDQVAAAWLWKGLHAKLVDGSTFTMPDTAENQAAFLQPHVQHPGVGFPLARACQSLLASWMLLATGACREEHTLYPMILAYIGANEVADRPGRIEPRVLKRHRDRYPHMKRPRARLQAELGKTQPMPGKELPTLVPFSLRHLYLPVACSPPRRYDTPDGEMRVAGEQTRYIRPPNGTTLQTVTTTDGHVRSRELRARARAG